MQMDLSLKQQLKISPRMIQQINILQMNSQQLEDHLNSFSMENPFAEVSQLEQEKIEVERIRKLEWLSSTDEQNRYYHLEDCEGVDEKDVLNIRRPEEITLRDTLKNQLLDRVISNGQRRILWYIIDSLDDQGYFRDDIKETAVILRKKTEEIEECLELIKCLDPAGVGAASLRECLLIQLNRRKEDLNIEKQIVNTCLELLGKNQIHVIARTLKLPIDRVIQAKTVIMSLNPKPSQGYSNRETMRYIVPDVYVICDGRNIDVSINQSSYPVLRVNREYVKLIEQSGKDREIRSFLSEKVRQIEQIQDCITRRNSTIQALTEFIVGWQQDFFLHGGNHILPLKLQEAAYALEVSESTVSRAVKDKYLQCKWGIFPLDHFFSRGVETEGEMVSAEQIKERIRKIIREENKKKPFSDQKLTEVLIRQGIDISRRTVAKYRESIGIADCRRRKEYID